MSAQSSVRRVVPKLLVTVMVVLTLMAATMSVRSSARISYFSSPAYKSGPAVTALHHAVRKTLDAPSFLLGGDSAPETIEYQAPNRTLVPSPAFALIVIGNKSYQELTGYKDEVTQWGEARLTPMLDRLFGPTGVKSQLRDLLNIGEIKRRGSMFYGEQVVSASQVSSSTAGQALIAWTITTRDGYVVGCRGTAYGIFQQPYFVDATQIRWKTARSIYVGGLTYSMFGEVARIMAPPRNKTVKLIPCSNGERADYGSESYVCGTLGTFGT